jgi:hypothetical protein
MCGKFNTQLIRLTTVIHVTTVSLNYLRHMKDCDHQVITEDFKKAIESSLQNAEFLGLFLNIPRVSVERGYNMLKYFFKSKMVFANFGEFREREIDFEQEMNRYLDRHPISNVRVAPIETYESKLLRKILLINQNVLTSVDLNKRFRLSKPTAVDIFQKLQENNFGVFLDVSSLENNTKLPCFKKLDLSSIHSNIQFSNSLNRINVTLKEFIDNYGDPINVDEYGNTLWPIGLSRDSSSISNASVFQSSIQADSTDGLQSSFDLNLARSSKSPVNEFSLTQRPIKTKSTSFMIDQFKDKTFKTNEDIINDDLGGTSTM